MPLADDMDELRSSAADLKSAVLKAMREDPWFLILMGGAWLAIVCWAIIDWLM